jgi:mRNA-degrading endonuclease toxin of MazEF toxin-antitoxin module
MSSAMWLAVVAVMVLGLIAALVDGRARSRRVPGRRARRAAETGRERVPRRGEVWWADVPYEDGDGSKDRPCLVLSVRGQTARVAKITSRQHEELPGVVPLPAGAVDDAAGRQSYLQSDELREVALNAFRRHAGTVDSRFMKGLNLR